MGQRAAEGQNSNTHNSCMQPGKIHGDEMINDYKLHSHLNWIFAISASSDSVFDPCWQHAGQCEHCSS